MSFPIPKLTLRRFKTRFSCSFLLQLLASCASERVQHHGAHPWVRGKLKQKRPKAILKNRHFLIKGVVWPRSCTEKPLPKLAAETKRPQQPKRFNSASPKSVANVFKAKKPVRQNVRKLMSAMVGHVKFGVFFTSRGPCAEYTVCVLECLQTHLEPTCDRSVPTRIQISRTPRPFYENSV